MERREAARRLIVCADDFGRSHSINQAVIRAHQEGILTTASLMVNGQTVDEAVELARQNPRLGVGLHLTLVRGTSALQPEEIPGLVNDQRNFGNDAVKGGVRYFFQRSLRPQLKREIAAQFQRLRQTGLKLDHVNGHLHFHLHPVVFSLLVENAREWGMTHFRLTQDPLRLNLRLASGRLVYRLSHALIFWWLATMTARAIARRQGIRHTRHVFGLLQNSRVDEAYVTRLLPRLPLGDSELYSHPSLDEFRHEFDALISPNVKALVEQHGIKLLRYQDL
jgi:hopanoid biosynthesis associated protein HpnK